MKLKNLLFGAVATAAMGVAAVSCTNEMVSPYPDRNLSANNTMLVQLPDIYAWSGSQQLGTDSRAAGPNIGFDGANSIFSRAGFTEITITDVTTKDLDADHESEIIDDYLPEQGDNLRDEILHNFLFKAEKDITFDLYPVYCQTNTPKHVGIFYYDNDGVYHEMEDVFNGITQHQGRFETKWEWSQEKGSYEVTTFLGKRVNIPKGYIFGFFWNGNNNNGETTYYSIESWNDECFYTTGGGQKIEPEKRSKLHGVTFELEGKTYLGLEDWTDFDFQDLVFTCPENLTEVPITDIPEKGQQWTNNFPGGTDNEPGDNDDVCNVPGCGHPKHDGEDCDQCDEGTTCHPKHDNDDDVCDVPGCGHPKHDGEDCDQCDEGTTCHPKHDNNDVCDVPGCGHPKHDGEDCEQCEEGTTCHPKHDEICDKDGCDHPKHDGKYCDQCEEGTTECHPCEKCGHVHKPGTKCDQCQEDGHGGCYVAPNPQNPTPAETPVYHNDEVEVNFSINDVHTDKSGLKYDNADVWTKLSIHVRKGTDVKIHVPLPGRYFCESDDFAIMQDHANGIYTGVGGDYETPGTLDEDNIYHHSMTYVITKAATADSPEKTWNVELHIDINSEGMDVWTDGITEELIEYLFEKNGDGINFEIWNYYQAATLDNADGQVYTGSDLNAHINEILDEVQADFNKATIEFLDEGYEPSYYINAFGYNWTDGTYSHDIRPRDCTVTPVDKTTFEMFPSYCYHLNGTPWNIVWVNKSVDTNSTCYETHTTTPTPPVAVDKYTE